MQDHPIVKRNTEMIRKMLLADVPKVVQIEAMVQSHPWTFKQFEESVESYQSTIIEHNGQVVGFCILQPVLDEANLLLMAIDPSQQGKGLGYRLLDQSLSMLHNNPVQIFLEVRESNLAAIALYEKSCFHQIDIRRNYYPKVGGGKENAIIMVKSCAESFADLFKI